MSDCVPYAIHIATGVPMETVMGLANKAGWCPENGMHAVAGWCLIRNLGFEVTPMCRPEVDLTVKRVLAGLDQNRTFIISVRDHWFAVRRGEPFDKGGTHPRTKVMHVFEVIQGDQPLG